MLLWILLTAMTSFAAVWLAAPLLAERQSQRAAYASGLAVYRDQLAEIERERRDGLIEADQADTAALEVKRRMLAVERGGSVSLPTLSLAQRHMSVATVVGLVAIGSAILYANLGRPDVPAVSHEPTTLVLDQAAQSYSFRRASEKPAEASPTIATATTAPVIPLGNGAAAGQGSQRGSLGTVDDMIERLKTRLSKDPSNVETLRMIGWSYAATGRTAEALEAYRKAVELAPKNAALLSAYGEVMVRTADGQVTPEALAIFDRAVESAPKDLRARFFKALALQQSGDKKTALDLYIATIADAPADDPAVADVRTEATKLAAELGVDIAGRLPAVAEQPLPGPPAETPAAAATAPRGPTAADVRAAEAMSEGDRSAMIRTMVDGLASRLEQSPRDVEGWVRLIRARQVMGETDKAKAALTKAFTVFGDSPDDQAKISAVAREAGLQLP